MGIMAESVRSVCAKAQAKAWKGLELARTLGLQVPVGRIVGSVLVSPPRLVAEDSRYHLPLLREGR